MTFVSYAEFNVPDTKQAAEFYKKVFEWEDQQWGDSDYLVMGNNDVPGTIGIGIEKMKEDRPITVAVISVPSVEEYAAKVEAAGGKIVVEKFAIPGQGYAAYFRDPGGLVVSIYEADDKAE